MIPVQPEIGDRPHRVTTLVVGGGLLGCAVAYLLAAADCEVLLVEKNQLTPRPRARTPAACISSSNTG